MTRAYLDWNATAPLRPEARAAWLAAQDAGWGNPASAHGWGQRARHELDQARSALGRALGAAPHELVLTSGGTEANALAIASAMAEGGDAVATAVEHSSVLRGLEAACARGGGTLSRVPVDRAGRASPEALTAACGERTRLVAVQLANNELGTRQDLPSLIAAVRAAAPRARVLVDACQGAGKTPLALRALGADFVSVAGHKLGAPKGIGLLWLRPGTPIEPLLHGGRQQQDRRSGTEDAALACAFAAAASAAVAALPAEEPRQRALLDGLWERLQTLAPRTQWIARDAERLANTMSLAHPGADAESLVVRLDLAGFAVSRGSACMSARGAPSHVVAALSLDDALARSVIRVSIGWATTEEELAAFAEAYAREVGSVSPG